MLLGRCVWPELREQRDGVVVVEDRQERVSLALPQLDVSGSLYEGLLVRWSKKSAGTCCSQTAVALPTSTTSVVISGQVSLSGRTRGRRRARHDPRLAPSSGQTARREDCDGFCAADTLRTGPNSHPGRSVIMALTCGFTSEAEGTRTPDPHTARPVLARPSTTGVCAGHSGATRSAGSFTRVKDAFSAVGRGGPAAPPGSLRQVWLISSITA